MSQRVRSRKTDPASKPASIPTMHRSTVGWNSKKSGNPTAKQSVVTCSREDWRATKDNPAFAGWASIPFALGVILLSPVASIA